MSIPTNPQFSVRVQQPITTERDKTVETDKKIDTRIQVTVEETAASTDKDKGYIHASTKKQITSAVAAVATLGLSLGLRGVVGLSLSAEGDTGISRGEAVKRVPDDSKANMQGIAVKSRGTTLDGMVIKPKDAKPLNYEKTDDNGDKKFTILLHGLGARYEQGLTQAQNYANTTNQHVLVFNYRGTGDSTGFGGKGADWVNDTVTMVEFLKSQGVKEENITIVGHSMGGGIGTVAASRFERVKLVSDRSFSSLGKATEELVKNASDNQVARVFLSGVGKIAGAAVSSRHNFNAAKVLTKNLNENKVDSLLSRTLILSAPNDEMIGEKAQAFRAVERDIKSRQLENPHEIKHLQLGLRDTLDYWGTDDGKFDQAYISYTKLIKMLNPEMEISNPEELKIKERAKFDKNPEKYLGGIINMINESKEKDNRTLKRDIKNLENDIKFYQNQHNLSMIELLKQNKDNFRIFKGFVNPQPPENPENPENSEKSKSNSQEI